MKPKIESEGLGTARIESLSDNVFSVAMTLLVLSIKVPELSSNAVHTELVHKLLELWPDFVTYIFSFILLGIFWIGHHNQYHFIKRTDRMFLWINILFLMGVAVFPFFTSLLAKYVDHPAALLAYFACTIVTALVLYWHWDYATDQNRLVDPLSPELIKGVKKRILLAPVCAVPLGALAFYSTKLTLFLYSFVLLYYIVPSMIDRYWQTDKKKSV